MKQSKQYTRLIDHDGWCWIEAELTPAQVKRLTREYQKQEIWLTIAQLYGKVMQVNSQLTIFHQ